MARPQNAAPYPELWDGLPIRLIPWMEDHKAYILQGTLLVGDKAPEDPVKLAGREARQMVRRGLADVLEWCGKPVVTEPILAAILDRRWRE